MGSTVEGPSVVAGGSPRYDRPEVEAYDASGCGTRSIRSPSAVASSRSAAKKRDRL
ncbi:hypothetical protein [Streptomyces roseochromogenus]|uniref:hypothetical protein n=1 Tax=Streptomyces roseochromogenus TaxID=285450 RepID=UPI000A7E3BCC|nr:hypothetical protein [Streptomyces roseochromogenus]